MPVKQLHQKADENYWDSLWELTSYEKVKFYAKHFKQYEIMKCYTDIEAPVLEGGCGLSHWVEIFQEEGYKITGVDYAPKVIERMKAIKPDVNIQLGNVFELNFPDEYFGTYFSWGVVEHFEEGPNAIIKEANRVIKKGGKLLISVPYWNARRINFYGEVSSIGEGEFYQYLFNKDEFKQILEENGFKVLKTFKQNWLKCYRDLKKQKAIALQKTASTQNKKQSAQEKSTEYFADPLWKSFIKRMLIKIEDLPLLTERMGHMILFVAEKK